MGFVDTAGAVYSKGGMGIADGADDTVCSAVALGTSGYFVHVGWFRYLGRFR